MAKFRKKVSEFTARQYMGPASTTVMHNTKGEMHAKKGDWLVGDEAGYVEVVKKEDFDRDYESVDSEDAPKEINIGTSELVIHHPDAKVVPVVGPGGIINTYDAPIADDDLTANKKAFDGDTVGPHQDTDGTLEPGEVPASDAIEHPESERMAYAEPHTTHDPAYNPNTETQE